MPQINHHFQVRGTHYNDQWMTDTLNIAHAVASRPEQLSPMLTFLGGKEDKRFPLSMLTEGIGNTKSIKKHEYEYDVHVRLRKTRPIAATPANTVGLGAGGATFLLSFPDRWFIKDYVLVSQSGVQVRIMAEPVPAGKNWDYLVRLVSPDLNVSLPADDVQAGKPFAQLFAPVGIDWSRGNASNWQSPATVRDRITTTRKSYSFSGNAPYEVVEFQLPKEGGGTTNRWMDYEEWQYFLQWKEECESYYWYGQRSYDEKGHTQMLDENNVPVYIGPGLLEQITQKETYSILTANKLDQVIGDLFFGMTDAQNKEVTLFTGTGGAREFDKAMKDLMNSKTYMQYNPEKFVVGRSRELAITGYFNRYEHIDGHAVNIVKVPMFDHGGVAEASYKHPVTGLPSESYRMVFVDQSTYNGRPNLQMLNKEGREMKRWAVAGSVVPRGFGSETDLLRASDIDGASVHYLKTGGIVLYRFDTSLDMQFKMAG